MEVFATTVQSSHVSFAMQSKISRQKTLIILFLFSAAAACSVVAQDNPLAEQSQTELIEVLRSDADTFTKAKACQRIAIIGDEACTDALTELPGRQETKRLRTDGAAANPR